MNKSIEIIEDLRGNTCLICRAPGIYDDSGINDDCYKAFSREIYPVDLDMVWELGEFDNSYGHVKYRNGEIVTKGRCPIYRFSFRLNETDFDSFDNRPRLIEKNLQVDVIQGVDIPKNATEQDLIIKAFEKARDDILDKYWYWAIDSHDHKKNWLENNIYSLEKDEDCDYENRG